MNDAGLRYIFLALSSGPPLFALVSLFTADTKWQAGSIAFCAIIGFFVSILGVRGLTSTISADEAGLRRHYWLSLTELIVGTSLILLPVLDLNVSAAADAKKAARDGKPPVGAPASTAKK